MFARSIIGSDAFLDMPQTARLLYYEIGMRADNNGVVNNIHSVCRGIGVEYENITMLENSGFISRRETEFYITHWDINNGIAANAKKRITYKYRKWRERVLIRDNYTCKNCGAKDAVLNVHHIKPFSKYEDLRYDIDNAITLCEKCHRALHAEERANAG